MAAHHIVSMPYSTLPDARALVDAAWDALDPLPSALDSQCSVLVRAMCRMFLVRGRLGFPRGYVQALQERMAGAGIPVPHSHTIRWYRSALQENPARFAPTSGVDVAVLERIELRYLG